MKVFLHIGSPKAGSSSLQRALRANADALWEQGVYAWLPDPAYGNFARALSNKFRGPKQKLMPIERRKFDTLDDAIAWSNACWEDIAEQVRTRKPDVTVLSSETLFNVADTNRVLETLGAIFEDVTIVAYVRDPADHYKSAVDQFIRGGARLSDLPLPSEFTPLARRALLNYVETLGPGSVLIRNFDRNNLLGGDVILDFAAQLSQRIGREILMPNAVSRSNESLCAPATAWLLSVNETFNRFPQVNDKVALDMRFGVIEKLRSAPALSQMPKLSLSGSTIPDIVRFSARSIIETLNTDFLQDQVPLPTVDAETQIPTAEAQRQLLQDWLLSQATGEQLELVLREVSKPVQKIPEQH